MTESNDGSGVIRNRTIKRIGAPVKVDGGDATRQHRDTMTVIPLLNGDKIEAFEVRCQCGAGVIVECVYGEVP